MIRRNLARCIAGLAVLGSLGLATRADDGISPSGVRIYRTGNSQQAPEQSVPKSTENKDTGANGMVSVSPLNGGDSSCTSCSEAESESVGWLQQHLNCSGFGSCLKVGGWLDQGFTWNPDSPDNRFNFPNTFNDRSNEYQLNQLYFFAEKPVKTDGCSCDFGGRIDVLLGTDYYFTTSTGWETESNGSQKWNSEDGPRRQFGDAAMYGIAIPQMYAEIYAPIGHGWDIKLGHFYTPMGYETVTATGNFFYSHAYTHQYLEPFTHWGVMGTSSVTDSCKIGLGAVLGWDTLNDAHEKLSLLATLTWTSCDKNTTFFYGILAGEEPGLLLNEETRLYQSIYLTHKMCDKFTSVTGTDLVFQDAGSFDNAGRADDAECYSFYQYLIYEMSKCCSAGVRFEVTRDDDNLRIVPIGSGPAALGLPGGFAEGGTFTSLTMGVNYKPCENVRIRPEMRWDWTDFNVGSLSAFDDGSDNTQFTAGLDVILTF